MTYRLWRSAEGIAVEKEGVWLVFSREEAGPLGLDLIRGGRTPASEERDELFRRLWAAGASYREIADASGLAQGSISNYRKRLGLPHRDASSAERGREKVDQLHSRQSRRRRRPSRLSASR